MAELFKTQNIWIAAAICYLYGRESVVQIEDLDNRTTEYGLAAPSEDIKIVLEEYDEDRLALSSAKAFVSSFNHVIGRQKEMRRHGETHWTSPEWIAGKIG